jgi:hypothetical protein
MTKNKTNKESCSKVLVNSTNDHQSPCNSIINIVLAHLPMNEIL